jgi:hypothetical protein
VGETVFTNVFSVQEDALIDDALQVMFEKKLKHIQTSCFLWPAFALAPVAVLFHAPAHGAIMSGAPRAAGPWTIVVPIIVASGRDPPQSARHVVAINPAEMILGRAGPVPAIRTAAPVPAALEEHFTLVAFYHLDARSNDNQGWHGRQAKFDSHMDLRLGCRRAQAEGDG